MPWLHQSHNPIPVENFTGRTSWFALVLFLRLRCLSIKLSAEKSIVFYVENQRA